MNDFVPLQNALKHNRFKEVVSGVLSAFENQPLNSAEIIQLGELALDAIERDPSNQKYRRVVLKKLAGAYSETSKHAEAKEVYRELYLQDRHWSDLEGLLTSLAQSGEIEELRQQVKAILPHFYRFKQTPQLKKIVEVLNQIGALNSLVKEIEFKIACFEGDYEKALSYKDFYGELGPEFIRDANWEASLESCGSVASLALDLNIIDKRLFVKKVYDAFMMHGPRAELLLAMLKYYQYSSSQHVGYFFSQNSGVKVELPSESWIDKIFQSVAKIEKPEEIEVELDLGEDLFALKDNDGNATFKQIKSLENRIAFLLKHGGRDEAKKLLNELLELDPNNKKFEKDFTRETKESKTVVREDDHWKDAWSTLAEIEDHALGRFALEAKEPKLSWKLIESADLVENYREYAYALIVLNQETDCIELLNKVIAISPDDFKDSSYLKARCYLNLHKVREALAVAESVIESCVLDEHESCELQYLRGECYEALNLDKEALAIYQAIARLNPKYRLVSLKIDRLGQK